MMNIRLILAFIASLLDEALVVAFLLWGLPELGVTITLPALIVISILLGVYAVVSFQLIMRALTKKPLVGMTDMAGSRGRVVSTLAPEGMVRIKGELWQAVSAEGTLNPGDNVIVVSQDGLILTVRKIN